MRTFSLGSKRPENLYPKGVKTITQADVMAATKASGLVDVKAAAFSKTHTALKALIPKLAR